MLPELKVSAWEGPKDSCILRSRILCHMDFFVSKMNASFGSLLHFLVWLKSHLLTVNQWQVCFAFDSCSSDMDHRQALLAVLEHLEHLVWFQKPICVDCLLPFRKIKKVLDTGVKFALWYTTIYSITLLTIDAKATKYTNTSHVWEDGF